MPKILRAKIEVFWGGLEPYDYLKFCKMYFLILKNVLFPYEIWFYMSGNSYNMSKLMFIQPTYLDKSSRWESPVAEREGGWR